MKTKQLQDINNKWFGIRLAMAFLHDYRFLQERRKGSLKLVLIRKRKKTAEDLRMVAKSINELADKLN